MIKKFKAGSYYKKSTKRRKKALTRLGTVGPGKFPIYFYVVSNSEDEGGFKAHGEGVFKGGDIKGINFYYTSSEIKCYKEISEDDYNKYKLGDDHVTPEPIDSRFDILDL